MLVRVSIPRRARLLCLSALAVALVAPAAAEPVREPAPLAIRLDAAALDRVTAAALPASGREAQRGPSVHVVDPPPRRVRDLLPWLSRAIGCALPGRVCIQG